MKKLLIILIILLLVGCYTTYKPVSTLTDSELRSEYWDVQFKLNEAQRTYQKHREPQTQKRPTSYTTTGSADTYGNTTYFSAHTTSNDYGGGGILVEFPKA